MSYTYFGNILVIANPAAQSGAGAQGARFVERFLHNFDQACTSFEVQLTSAQGHAEEIARHAQKYDTVFILGGDGVIHEAINGLMHIDTQQRPDVGIIPLGSGNDFAKTLGMYENDPQKSVQQLFCGTRKSIDLGCINNTYFMETLSFGIDAEIGLRSMQTRTQKQEHGSKLFLKTGLDVFCHMRHGSRYTVCFDNDEVYSGENMIFAVQLGPTYGGGFRICPNANPYDGVFDVCYSVKTPPLPQTLALFCSALYGKHTHSSCVRFKQCKQLHFEFEEMPPCQVDGEPLHDTHFDVTCVPQSLRVIVPSDKAH